MQCSSIEGYSFYFLFQGLKEMHENFGTLKGILEGEQYYSPIINVIL
jgi:hypothetical protein